MMIFHRKPTQHDLKLHSVIHSLTHLTAPHSTYPLTSHNSINQSQSHTFMIKIAFTRWLDYSHIHSCITSDAPTPSFTLTISHINLLIWLIIHLITHPLTTYLPLIYSLTYSLTHSVAHTITEFIRSFTRSFHPSLTPTRSSIHIFTQLLIHSFNHKLIKTYLTHWLTLNYYPPDYIPSIINS